MGLRPDAPIRQSMNGFSVELGSLPHLFDVVELTHFGTENMDDDIARVDQHPITAAKAFDLDAIAMPALFQSAQKLVRNRRYVTMRTSRRDDHMITDNGLASQVDGDNVFGLGVFKTSKNRLKGERYGTQSAHLRR